MHILQEVWFSVKSEMRNWTKQSQGGKSDDYFDPFEPTTPVYPDGKTPFNLGWDTGRMERRDFSISSEYNYQSFTQNTNGIHWDFTI